MENNNHERWMKKAIDLAIKAREIKEIPVGAIIVKENKIIASGFNRRETTNSALAHAEIEAIQKACTHVGNWRLNDCTMYVTLEPCAMCAGALINSRIDMVVFGANDPKAGCCGSVINLFDKPFNHKPKLLGSILEEQCAKLLTDFFKELREKRK